MNIKADRTPEKIMMRQKLSWASPMTRVLGIGAVTVEQEANDSDPE